MEETHPDSGTGLRGGRMGQALGMLTEAHLLTVQALDARKAWASLASSLRRSHELIQMQTFRVKN